MPGDDLIAIADAHAALEAGQDLDALMATMEGEPVYEFRPVGLRFRGREKTRRLYAHLMQAMQPRMLGYAQVSYSVGTEGVVQEYDVVVRHADDEPPVTHRVIAMLVFGTTALSGERIYADERFLRALVGPLWEELEPIPDSA